MNIEIKWISILEREQKEVEHFDAFHEELLYLYYLYLTLHEKKNLRGSKNKTY